MQIRTSSWMWRWVALTFGFDATNRDQWPKTHFQYVIRILRALFVWFVGLWAIVFVGVNAFVFPAINLYEHVTHDAPLRGILFVPLTLVIVVGTLLGLLMYQHARNQKATEPPPDPKFFIWLRKLKPKSKPITYVDD